MDTTSGDGDMTPINRDRCFTWPTQPAPSNESTPSCSTSDINEPTTSLHYSITDLNKKCSPTSVDGRSGSGGGGVNASKKPNPWGEQSYADLITIALSTAPQGRLKLNEVYQWFSDNIPYFTERSSPEGAAGWKNSIRHNLSLHSRFMRIQNEGAGKSSWWVINPDVRAGKASRRRAATIDSTTNKLLDRKRTRAKRKVERAADGSTGDVLVSPGDDGDSSTQTSSTQQQFRNRSNSTLSNYSSGGTRMSPHNDYDTFWTNVQAPADTNTPSAIAAALSAVQPAAIPGEIIDRTGQIQLNHHQPLTIVSQTSILKAGTQSGNGGALASSTSPSAAPGCRFVTPIKAESSPATNAMQQQQCMPPMSNRLAFVPKLEPMPMHMVSMQQGGGQFENTSVPPSYSELYASTNCRLLRDALQHGYTTHNGQPTTNQRMGASTHIPLPPHPLQQLPSDIAHINCDNWQRMDIDIDPNALLRHELRMATNGQLDFSGLDNV